MNKIIVFWVILISCLLSNHSLYAQGEKDTLKHWRRGGFVSIILNQTSLTNWAAGGESNVSSTGILNLFAQYKKGETTWDNFLDLGYGFIKPSDYGWRKNDDKLDLTSKYGKLAKGKFYYSLLFNFKSQFDKGFNFPNDSEVTSKFMAPAFATLSLGMEYKPVSYFSAFLSPATGKLTLVLDQTLADKGAFGVEKAELDNLGNILVKGKQARFEFGAYFWARFQKDIFKNTNLATKINLFNNYTDKNRPNRKNIDVDWQTAFVFKANKLLTTTIFCHLIYDNDINIPVYKKEAGVKVLSGNGPRVQFKQLFGVGISYKFGDKQ